MSVQYTLPTISQLQFLSLNPPQCYCKKPAHRNYTLEYGPILECASYGNTKQDNYQANFTCGFHIHELSWIKLIQQVKNGSRISSHYSELRACPLYNFTYQTIFNLVNDFNKITPFELPKCFCHNTIKLCCGHPHYFSCQNRSKEGARKCSWYLEAKDVAFIKPKFSLHTYVSLETYERNYRIKKSIFESRWLEVESEMINNQTILETKNEIESLISETENDLLLMMDKAIKTKEKLTRIKLELEPRKRKNIYHVTNK